MRKHPRRTNVDPQNPRAWGTSDQNGMVGQHNRMKWQHEWAGNRIINRRILVHEDELDIPNRQLGNLVLPADPPPIRNARVENYSIDEQPISTRYTIQPSNIGGPNPGGAFQIRVIMSPPGQPYLTHRIVTTPGGVLHVGAITTSPAPSGGTTSGPSLDFSKSSNSMYIGPIVPL